MERSKLVSPIYWNLLEFPRTACTSTSLICLVPMLAGVVAPLRAKCRYGSLFIFIPWLISTQELKHSDFSTAFNRPCARHPRPSERKCSSRSHQLYRKLADHRAFLDQ